ncbi:osteopetrosis-associated transmembrane protein 1 [Erpetoichthys calabaricus]|nr:osteopetrosis-associated transmembrane protein 1 [Erpetoichthys calabaricus]
MRFTDFIILAVYIGLSKALQPDGLGLPVAEWRQRVSLSELSLSATGFSDSFPLSIDDSHCQALSENLTQKCNAFVNCTLRYAQPVGVCLNCYKEFYDYKSLYRIISLPDKGSTDNCSQILLKSDRLQVFVVFNDFFHKLWEESECENCVSDTVIKNDTLYFLNVLQITKSCFDTYQQPGNYCDVCKQCKENYSHLNEVYNKMGKNSSLCIDIEDMMNMTRKMWSKTFNCSFSRLEAVPVIAVSSFMLFLPIIFYLSSFLHSEQKKRKLILPKRAASSSNLMNIQEKKS